MTDNKSLIVPIYMGTKLPVEQCLTTLEEIKDMVSIPYVSVFGSFMYGMFYTRIDISHAMGAFSWFMANLGCEHWAIVKRVFRYLRGTFDYFVFYHSDVLGDLHSVDIHGYVDFYYRWKDIYH